MYSAHDITALKGHCSWLSTCSHILAITTLFPHQTYKAEAWEVQWDEIIHSNNELGVIRIPHFYCEQTVTHTDNGMTIVFFIKRSYHPLSIWPWCPTVAVNFSIYQHLKNSVPFPHHEIKQTWKRRLFFFLSVRAAVRPKWKGKAKAASQRTVPLRRSSSISPAVCLQGCLFTESSSSYGMKTEPWQWRWFKLYK